ncbi:MAG: signal recognition particle-docking protein FtsY, partial [Deltaproteobacteria bacterium]|nr:signal recognition particle-docking protein FtsY [Deltaproteobacteria bacterium]
MPSWVGPLAVALFLGLVGVMFVAALRRARRRRAEEYAEEEPRRGAPEPPERSEPPPPAPEEPEATPEPEVQVPTAPTRPAKSDALIQGLAGTRNSLLDRLRRSLGRGGVGPEVLTELEDALLLADVGVQLSSRMVSTLAAELKARALTSTTQVRDSLKAQLLRALAGANSGGDPLALGRARPHVILFVGVNGVGKTTTIGKIAAQLRGRGHSVVLAAGDTFRAAAVEQLNVWGERTGCEVVRGEEGADPASVAYRAVEQAARSGADVALIDTAGRMHTRTGLMDELKKVKRSLGKARQGAPDQIWLVVDATTGQNALQQAREFHDSVGVTGIILTKLDGTAKGGVVVAIAD